jgi:hypothetical protein
MQAQASTLQVCRTRKQHQQQQQAYPCQQQQQQGRRLTEVCMRRVQWLLQQQCSLRG